MQSSSDYRFSSTDGVGMVMGPCRLVGIGDVELLAIDLDGDVGLTTMRRLCEQHGRPPTTLTAATGGGGVHLVYALPASGEARSRILNRGPAQGAAWRDTYPGLDLRAAGGQIVVAPTQHWSGKKYRWTRPMLPVKLPTAWNEALTRMVDEVKIGR